MGNNEVHLIGVAAAPPQKTHTIFGESFYRLIVRTERTSKATDDIPVTISEKLFPMRYIEEGDRVEICGEFRSKNKDEDGKRHLILYVFARRADLCVEKEESVNRVDLRGFLCRSPVRRQTPLGREIADLMLAVNRRYGRADYLPCLAWGRDAAFAETLRAGDCVEISGRIQSRNYIKKIGDCECRKTAWEVSCQSLSLCEDDC